MERKPKTQAQSFPNLSSSTVHLTCCNHNEELSLNVVHCIGDYLFMDGCTPIMYCDSHPVPLPAPYTPYSLDGPVLCTGNMYILMKRD